MLPRDAAQGRQDDSDIPSRRPRVWRSWKSRDRFLGETFESQAHWENEIQPLTLVSATRSSTLRIPTLSIRRPSHPVITALMPRMTENTYIVSAMRRGRRARRRSALTCTGLCMCRKARHRAIRWKTKVRRLLVEDT